MVAFILILCGKSLFCKDIVECVDFFFFFFNRCNESKTSHQNRRTKKGNMYFLFV